MKGCDFFLRGFELVLKQGDSLNIASLFYGIDLERENIRVVESEIIVKNRVIRNDNNEEKRVVSAIKNQTENIKTLIHKLVAQFYPDGALPSAINTYYGFLRSDCDLVLLVYDMNYVEVYVKQWTWLCQLLKNAAQLPIVEFNIKTEQTDPRSDFYV